MTWQANDSNNSVMQSIQWDSILGKNELASQQQQNPFAQQRQNPFAEQHQNPFAQPFQQMPDADTKVNQTSKEPHDTKLACDPAEALLDLGHSTTDDNIDRRIFETLEKSVSEFDDHSSICSDPTNTSPSSAVPVAVTSIPESLIDSAISQDEAESSSLQNESECIPNTACSSNAKTAETTNQRFKPFHEEKWTLRYKELLQFHQENGHAAVPHTYPKNPQLARWVKRQRRQYKLRKDGKPSTMTTERLVLLDSCEFIWDSHEVTWREKLNDLENFRDEHGHCNVPSTYKDKKLATWVKCQRRQYKLYWDGKPSAMNPERILQLEKAGFEWEIRSVSSKSTGTPGADFDAFVSSFF